MTPTARPRGTRLCILVMSLLLSHCAAGSAHGFFFPGWAGSGVKNRQPLVTPPPAQPFNPPSTLGPPDDEDQPPIRPDDPGDRQPPPAVPEPASVVSALVGLACVARLRRRKPVEA